MKLIASLTSPYARKVRIVLAEKKIDCPLEEETPWSADSRVPEYNPLGKVPVLELDDGSTLYDSRVIVEYLDNSSPVSRLLPQDNRQLIGTRRWEALADGIIDAMVAIVLERRRPPEKQMEEVVERQRGKIARALATLSQDLGEKPWCTSHGYSLADIAVGCCLGYLDFRAPELDWRASHPNLDALLQRLYARQSFIDTEPPAA
ncbi:glutathione S-transferase [Chromobacterium subtsugae]|uniref:Glutathione S-transferase n=2 Tax=Pseudomonadota TaxID=1224 RepID=A0ABS7FC93_9NEIS|nr:MULTISPECIES: glutathione S-transferase [Chromobacterium]KUM05660.1 glutathione S-transferase [Chromobacterium subtsugae]KZE87173.1 glutathione S-transferase [Chromobacterium sp. F49]MBW7565880.1 glutathione S-transferase [Chromobacterium subtsugae]MBW8287080.1 glutathione S-transferase [Chromobacterium subtsugae]OBU88157.1 glutathione S-transferase [Chromobacterium subtsugae]